MESVQNTILHASPSAGDALGVACRDRENPYVADRMGSPNTDGTSSHSKASRRGRRGRSPYCRVRSHTDDRWQLACYAANLWADPHLAAPAVQLWRRRTGERSTPPGYRLAPARINRPPLRPLVKENDRRISSHKKQTNPKFQVSNSKSSIPAWFGH